jgi:hypothetical protein
MAYGKSMKEILFRYLAVMDDSTFEAWSAWFGYTRRPEESGGETIANFRSRVVKSVENPWAEKPWLY